MKRTYVLTVAKNLTNSQHRSLSDSIEKYFAWADVCKPGIQEYLDLSVSRRDGSALILDDRAFLRAFVAGFLMANGIEERSRV